MILEKWYYIGMSGDVVNGGAGLIVANPATKTAFGSLAEPNTLLAVAGLAITAGLVVRRVRGALLFGIFGTAIWAWLFKVSPPPQGFFALPNCQKTFLVKHFWELLI
jgi:AGZA family xanthine/uracil permease-like MFS transporter